MTRCYDSALRETMAFRALIALAVLVSCAFPGLAAAGPWRAVATSANPAFPRVEVECGFPDGYVSSSNTPIRLRARTGARPFDGYIGFSIKVDGQGTVDVPVIARAVIPANSDWTFSSWMDVRGSAESVRRLADRELFVTWRDAEAEIIESRSAGKPPWSSPRPLRIRAGAEVIPDDTYLGEKSVLLGPAELSTQPIWYTGFSSVVVPTVVWFELPQTTRDAIFRSMVRVHFFGVPAAMPNMSPRDRALLPIELVPGSSIAWRAKRGANILGSPSLPDLVANDIATFAASEEGLRTRVPAFAHRPLGEYVQPLGWDSQAWRPREILREYRPLLTFSVVLLMSVLGWLAIRRVTGKFIYVAVPALAIAALVVIGLRDWIRPREGTHTYTTLTLAAPGVVDVHTERRDYGIAPRAVSRQVLSAFAGTVTRRINWAWAEIRDSNTPPGLGALLGGSWQNAIRESKRREMGTPATMRIVSLTPDEMVVDFESNRRVDYVAARWTWNGTRRDGSTRVTPRSSGRAIVRNRQVVAQKWTWPSTVEEVAASVTPEDALTGATRVALFTTDREQTSVIRYVDSSDQVTAPPYQMAAALRPDENGVPSASLALPGPIPPRAKARLTLTQVSPSSLGQLRTIRLEGPAGSAAMDLTRIRQGVAEIGGTELRRVAPGGGVVRLLVEPGTSAGELSRGRATVVVFEEKQ